MPFIASPHGKTNPGSRPDVPSGTLRQRPSEHLVLYTAERGLSGTLWLHHTTRGSVTLVFSRGAVWKARSDIPLPLGELIYEIGMAPRRVIDEAMATAARDKRLLGEVLVTRGMLEPLEVQRALALQLQRKVTSALAFPDETVWAFYAGEDSLEGYGGKDWPRVHPHGAVWQYASANAHDSAVRSILGRFVGKRLELKPEVASRFGFEESERARVDALKGGVDITPALLRDTRSPVARLVYVLVLSRALVPYIDAPASSPSGAAPSSQSGVPSSPLSAPFPSAAPSKGSGSMPVTTKSGTMALGGDKPSFAMPRPNSSMPSDLPASRGSGVPSGAPSAPPHTERSPVLKPPQAHLPSPVSRVPEQRTSSVPNLVRPRVTPPPLPQNRTMMPPGSSAAVPQARTLPPTSGRRRVDSEPEVQRPRTTSELGVWIKELHENLNTMDHYEILGVPRDATSEAIRAIYMRNAREIRPERLPNELASLRLPAARVAQRMAASFRMLMDRNSRRVYDERLGSQPPQLTSSMPPPPDRRELAAIVDKKLERGEIESAERLCRRTIEATPGDAEALSLLAWVRSHIDRYASEAEVRVLVGQLDEAVESMPGSALVHYCRARFHKRKGSQVQAIRDFMKTVELDPQHTDAERELRLYRLRRERERGTRK